MSIRRKLTILFLAVGLFPTLLVSVFAYISVSNELTDKTIEQIGGIASKQEQRISALLQNKQEEAIRLAGAQYDLQSALSAYITTHKQADLDTILTFLRNRKAELPQLQTIHITDLNGNIIATTASSFRGQKLGTDDIDVQASQPSTVRLREDKTDGIDKLYITARIYNNKEEIARLLVIYKLDDIVATVQDYTGLGETGETVVGIQKDGHVISLFPTRFNADAAQKTSLDSLHLFDRAATPNVTDYEGKEVIVATKSVDAAHWGLATKIDRSEALAPIVGLRNIIIGIFAGCSLMLILLALFFARRFTAPISNLTKKTRQIMDGDFMQQIDVTTKDEIGTLGSTFNLMASKLALSYRALEQKVSERTSALNQKMQELSKAKARDDAILDSVGEGMIVTDSAGRILLTNAIAADLMGISSTNGIGKPIAQLPISDDSDQPIPPEQNPMQLALKSGQKVVSTIKVTDKDGTKRSLGVTATHVVESNSIVGAIQIIRDTTKEKEVDRMKTEFISLASHQLRTPLSAIKWFNEMMLNGDAGKLTTEQAQFAQNIGDSTKRMIELVNSLLNISRIESGRIIIDPKPTDLNELISGIVNDLKAKTAERGQTLIVSVYKDLPKINIDPHLIGQVYLNLLTNAIKYTPKGGEISVFVSRKDDQIVSQITDNGYGIPKEEQHKMFSKFFRASNIVKVETDGTGLGMYLLKAIIDSSGGKIWFESEEGKGTTFWFALPMSGMKAKTGEVTLDS